MNKLPVLQSLYEFVEFERVAVPCLVLDTKHTKRVSSKQMDNGSEHVEKLPQTLASFSGPNEKDLGTRLQS